MHISKAQIEAVKQSNDIVSVIKSKGIKLKKKSKNYVALCPFHKENTPSFTVDPVKQLWNCFGCSPGGKGSTGGDVIGFVVKYDNIGFTEAIELLSNGSTGNGIKGAGGRNQGAGKTNTSKPAPFTLTTDNCFSPASLSSQQQKLFNRVIDFYHTTFTEDHRGFKYLSEERKITNKDIFRDFKIGFSNGTLLKTILNAREIVQDLQTIGILTDRKKELFCNCVTFPIFNHNDEPVGIYGRKIKNNEINHLYLPGPHQGVFNRQAARAYNEIILCEGIIDCLTLYDRGFKNVIPCYGTNGLTSHHLDLFKAESVKTVYIAFDGDDAGRKAVSVIGEKLNALSMAAYPISLPDGQDVNDYFKQNTHEEFERLLKEVKPDPVTNDKVQITNYEKTEDGFIATHGTRKYQIIGISKNKTHLKATVKAIREVEGKTTFHVDTVDFYSARSRLFMVKSLFNLFGEEESIINDDLNHILEKIGEQTKEETPAGQDKITISPQEKEEAMKFLKSSDIFKEILADFEIIGYTGEETNKLVSYLTVISRKLDNPLSIMIQSRSAAGKSSLQDAALSLVPDEDYVKYTRITDQALFYKEEDSLVHKILAIEEAEGMGGAAYSIRNIQSSKSLSIASTGKDPVTGKQRTEEHKVNGPVVVMLSTTRPDIDEETASRFICISIDESKEMTERIHKMQRAGAALAGLLKKKKRERIIRKHHNIQRMLKPLSVANPYSDYLTYPSDTLVTRRDHKKYLALIEVIAFIHQYQRKRKTVKDDGEIIEYIEVTLDDIAKANEISNEVLGRSLDELSPQARNLLILIHKMVKEKAKTDESYSFRRREIREYTGWSDWQIKYHIKELVEMEYLYVQIGSKGKEYVYELNYSGHGQDGKLFFNGLTNIKEIKRLMREEKKRAAG